jgi:4-carboxymuconolactone decarboxylase
MLRLYAGFPATIEFLRALSRAWPARTVRRAPASYGAWRSWQERGVRLCRRIYGPDYPRLRAFMRALDPDLDHWMILEGYGKTLARPGLTLAERELATVAALAALGWSRQQAAHAAGARRIGAPATHVARAERIGLRCRRAHHEPDSSGR